MFGSDNRQYAQIAYTPVVCVDIGGNSDLVLHKRNGYLAHAFDTDDLAQGIEEILSDENYDAICQNARSEVVTKYHHSIVSPKYIELYKDIFTR